MSKKIKLLLLSLIIIASVPFFVGLTIKSNYQQMMQSIQHFIDAEDFSDKVSIELTEYRLGWLSSTALVKHTIGLDDEVLTLNETTKIQHGPFFFFGESTFPQFIGLARTQSQYHVDEKSRWAFLNNLLAPVSSESFFQFDKQIRIISVITPFSLGDSNSAFSLNFFGSVVEVATDIEFSSVHGSIEFAGLDIDTMVGTGRLSNLYFESDAIELNSIHDFYLNSFVFRIEQLVVNSPIFNGGLEDFSLIDKSTLRENIYDWIVELSVGKLQIDEYTASLVSEFALANLDIQVLTDLINQLKTISQNKTVDTDEQVSVFEFIQENVLALLKNEVILAYGLEAVTSEGNLSTGFEAVLPVAQVETLEEYYNEQLSQELFATLDLSMPTFYVEILLELFASDKKESQLAFLHDIFNLPGELVELNDSDQLLANLVEAGVLTKDEDNYALNYRYANGESLLNEQEALAVLTQFKSSPPNYHKHQ